MWLLFVLAAVLAIAGLSAGCALALHLIKPEWSESKRTLISAAVAGILPMSIVFGGFFAEAEVSGDDFMLGLGALVLMQVMVLTICALPPAWWTTNKLSKEPDALPALPESEDAPLIEG